MTTKKQTTETKDNQDDMNILGIFNQLTIEKKLVVAKELRAIAISESKREIKALDEKMTNIDSLTKEL